MKKGENSIFTIKSQYGYGESAQGKIPANATLIFEITLLEFKDKEKNKWDFSDVERLEKGKVAKEEGNVFFK